SYGTPTTHAGGSTHWSSSATTASACGAGASPTRSPGTTRTRPKGSTTRSRKKLLDAADPVEAAIDLGAVESRPASNRVPPPVARQDHIVPRAAVEEVGPRPSVQHVVSLETEGSVVARERADNVRCGSGDHGVHRDRARDRASPSVRRPHEA